MNELIPVIEQENGKVAVSGRMLYDFLDLTERFSKWWDRMIGYGFEINLDYSPYQKVHPQNKQIIDDYSMTLDMAKEVAMLQRNEKGKQARKYFIEVEKRYKQQAPINNLSPQLQYLISLETKQNEIDKKVSNIETEVESIKNDSPLYAIECEELSNAVRKRGVQLLGGKDSYAYANKSVTRKVFSAIYKQLHFNFGVSSYKAIKRQYLNTALEIVETAELPIVLADIIRNINAQMSLQEVS